MLNAGKRAFLWLVLLLAGSAGAYAAPGMAAMPADELAAAQQEAELGGLTSQTALRAMLWVEPRAVAAFLPLKPAASEEVHLAEAEARAKAILANDPGQIQALALLGRLAWVGGRANDATNYFQRALLYAADSSPALLGLADLYLDRREPDRARAFLASIKTKNTEAEVANDVTLRLAVLALWQGDGQGAVAFVSAASPPGGTGVSPSCGCWRRAWPWPVRRRRPRPSWRGRSRSGPGGSGLNKAGFLPRRSGLKMRAWLT